MWKRYEQPAEIYLKQHGLGISESKADLTILNEFSVTHVEMQPEMFWKMKNLITCVKTAQLQNQSQVIPMERTHTLKSHLYFLCLMKTSNTKIRYEGTNAERKQGGRRGGGVVLNIISR